MNPARRSARRSRRGFSLIELGIVIAVIAVLAAVVIFGRGFILAARVTKAVDATNTLRKAGATIAGLNGGSFGTAMFSGGSQLKALSDRNLIPPLAANTPWTVSGDPNSQDAIKITDVRFSEINGVGNAVAIKVTCVSGAMATDIMRAVMDDKNVVTTAAAIGNVTCTPALAATVLTTGAVTLCFRL